MPRYNSRTKQTTKTRRRHRTPIATASEPSNFFPFPSIPGLAAWFDFSDASTLFTDAGTTQVSADGNAIYQVNDKSGITTPLVQTTAGDRPLYKTNIVNGKSVARFAATDDIYNGANTSGKPISIFVVFATNGAGTYRELYSTTTAGGALLRLSNVDKPNFLSNATVDVYTGTNAVSDATWTTISCTYSSGGVCSHYTNGAANGSTTNDQVIANGTIRLSAATYVGDIAEVISFTSVLSATDHNRVGNYLANKYGLTWTTVS